MDASEDSGRWLDTWCLLTFTKFFWLVVVLTRTSCHKITHANGYYGAWPGWAVSASVLPLTILPAWTDSHCQFSGRLRKERHSGETAPGCVGHWTHLLLARLPVNPTTLPPSLHWVHLLPLGLQFCPLLWVYLFFFFLISFYLFLAALGLY